VTYVRIARADELWEGETLSRRVADVDMFLVHLDGEVRAYENRCPHLGRPLLDGIFPGDTLFCPAHGWQYDARSGEGTNPCGVRLRTFPVRIEQGDIFVEVDDIAVGPVFTNGELATAAVAAIVALNPDVEVIDRGGYLRVRAMGRCLLTADALRGQLGRELAFPREVEAIMTSFSGKLSLSESEIVWAKR
jgi:toluene monooxygenase system ferredoxin subunit